MKLSSTNWVSVRHSLADIYIYLSLQKLTFMIKIKMFFIKQTLIWYFLCTDISVYIHNILFYKRLF